VSAEDKAESHSLRDRVALSCRSYRHAVILSPRTDSATHPAPFRRWRPPPNDATPPSVVTHPSAACHRR